MRPSAVAAPTSPHATGGPRARTVEIPRQHRAPEGAHSLNRLMDLVGERLCAVEGRLVRYDGKRLIGCGTCTVQVLRRVDGGFVVLPYGIDPELAGSCPHGVLLDAESARKIARALGDAA